MKNRVSEARKEKGLSQAALAKAAGISRPYLSTIECGKQDVISNVVMMRIARVLEEKVERLFCL